MMHCLNKEIQNFVLLPVREKAAKREKGEKRGQLLAVWCAQVSNLIRSGSGKEGRCAKLNQIRLAAC